MALFSRLEDVQSAEPEGDDVLRVVMPPIVRRPVTFHGAYRRRYEVPAPDRVVWGPSGRGDTMRMRGEARLAPTANGCTRVDFAHRVEAEIAMSLLVRTVAGPIAIGLMRRGVERFVELTCAADAA